jgi:hypothetical protein
LINEARVKPLLVIERLGLDEEKARLALGEDEWILDRGLPPVALNGILLESASKHGQDMIENLYYSSVSLDGRTVEDRVAEVGYEAANTGESLSLLAFQKKFIDPMKAAELMFENLVSAELNPESTLPKNIFGNNFSELGIAFTPATLDLGERLPFFVYLVVMDFAEPLEFKSYLIGSVYRDLNEDGLFGLGEGISDATAMVRSIGAEEGDVVVTGPLGSYQFELPLGFSEFTLRDGNGTLLKRRMFFTLDGNFFLDVWLK